MSSYEISRFQRVLVESHDHDGDCAHLPGSVCRVAMRAAVERLISEGWSDEEVWIGASGPRLSLRAREALTVMLLEARGETPRRRDEPTQYAREKIAEVPAVVSQLRRDWRKVTRSAVAQRVGVNRDTLRDWIKRGWLDWPPAE